ncbi:hypothetical protein CAPTEDRAFT_217608 [Capitella teleta]|uniref:BTB domain-containing protein n=1 Tax=Capitella teleta TaxID=283909 RepID=R7UG50_CAPTE|nr:hypothetical protein CAPTEDRAFT_217608 [Capitella teleta]|eukprot:ELU05509.1 hypothetical protein CAPTEDRAFT_217608 [Capitella teleta]
MWRQGSPAFSRRSLSWVHKSNLPPTTTATLFTSCNSSKGYPDESTGRVLHHMAEEAAAELLYMEDDAIPIPSAEVEQGNLFVQSDDVPLIQVEGAITMADAEFVSEHQKKYTLLPMALSNSINLPSAATAVEENGDQILNTVEPTDRSPVFSADPYSDPPVLSSPYSFRVFNCLNDVQTIIKRIQDSAGVKFNCCKKGANFGIEEHWNTSKIDTEKNSGNFRILFQWSTHERSVSRFSLPFIPFNGVPFMSVSHLVMTCEHLSLRDPLSLKCEQVKEYRRKVVTGEIAHPDEPQASTSGGEASPAKRRKISEILPPGVQRFRETKKTGCNAVLTVKQIACFPDYTIPPNMQADHKIRQTISSELRWKLQKRPQEEFAYEMRYYMRIPNSWAHSMHEIRVQYPKYISQPFRDRILNYLMTLKEREILSDIKFNIQGQKRQLKLHSTVLACGGVKIRDLLIRQDYNALADMLVPLNKASLDAFFNFLYSGHLEVIPEVDINALEAVFRDAGIKEGADQCTDHRANAQAIELDDWTLSTASTPVKRSLHPVKTNQQAPISEPETVVQHRATALLQTLSTILNFDDSEIWRSEIEQVILTETDSHAIMKRVVLDRLASHFSAAPSCSHTRCPVDKATCTGDLPQIQSVSPRSKSEVPKVSYRAVKIYAMKPGDANKLTGDVIKVKAQHVKNVKHK